MRIPVVMVGKMTIVVVVGILFNSSRKEFFC